MNVCPRIGKRRWLALLVAAWTVLASGHGLAQGGPRVGATLQDPVVEVNEGTEYQISVVNGRAETPPPAPVLAGLAFQYIGPVSSRNMFLGGGGLRMSDTTTYRYAVRAARPGRYVIPGQEVMVGGSALRTLPLTLTVEGTGAGGGGTPPSQTVSAELIIPKKSAYVGESFPVEVRSYFGTDVSAHVSPDVTLTGEGFSVRKFTPPVIRSQVIEGIHYDIAFYKSAVVGLKIGTLAVGPAETEPIVQLPMSPSQRRRANDPYNLFGGLSLQQAPQQMKINTEPVTLEIKPLPPGKPETFTGGIGQFKLDVEAEPRRAQAGDPVTVRLILSGQGNFERIGPPLLADEHGLKAYPPNAKFKADDEVGMSGVKTFEQVVIADGARTSLPSYRFSYLDPATGKYASLDTPPASFV